MPTIGAPTTDGIDFAVLKKTHAQLGSRFLMKYIPSFLDTLASCTEKIVMACTVLDPKVVDSQSHHLKASCHLIGAGSLCDQCAELQELCRAGAAPGEIAAAVTKLERKSQLFDRQLRAYLAGLDEIR